MTPPYPGSAPRRVASVRFRAKLLVAGYIYLIIIHTQQVAERHKIIFPPTCTSTSSTRLRHRLEEDNLFPSSEYSSACNSDSAAAPAHARTRIRPGKAVQVNISLTPR